MFRSSAPGFLLSLQQQLESLSEDDLKRICRPGGLDIHDMLSLILKPIDTTIYAPDVPADDAVIEISNNKFDFIGKNAIENGEVAVLSLDDSFDPSSLNCSVKRFWRVSRNGSLKHHESIALLPDYSLMFGIDNKPVFYSCGSGDILPILQESGILKSFIDEGGKHIAIVSSSNLNISVVGYHIENYAPVTCEVTRRIDELPCAVLCSPYGDSQIVQDSRFVHYPSTETFLWKATGTTIFDAKLNSAVLPGDWHREKKLVDNKLSIQFIRHFQDDMTTTFRTQYVTNHT